MKINHFLSVLFILFFVTTQLSAQNVYVPDDNFEQALIDLGYDTGTLNDSVQLSVIQNLTFLYVNNKSIKDLTGIEHFEKIETLYCNDNLLTNLDLSLNFYLKNIVCQNNQLTEIILGLKIDLITLSCYNNKLENIDLTSALNLQRLICNGNSLSTLDLTLNNKLTNLDVSNNQLTSLNIKNGNNAALTNLNLMYNENLYCVEVDDPASAINKFGWYRSGFTNYSDNCSLFSDKMTYVPDDNFEQALISNGFDYTGLNDSVPTEAIKYITGLILDNRNIVDLTGIQDFLSLDYLDCNNNQIQSLDLSLNPKLRYLYCHQNQIQSLDLSTNYELIFLYANDNQLTNLNLQNGNNSKMNVNVLNNPDLTCIQVDEPETAHTLNWAKSQCTGFSDDCSTFKLQMVYIPDDKFEKTLIDRGIDCSVMNDSVPAQAIDKIETLDIRGFEITDLTGIEAFKSLKTLDCSSNYLPVLNMRENHNLENLYCAYNGFTDLQVPTSNLKHLDCSYNNLDSLNILQAGKIEKLYCGNNKLKTIDLTGNLNLNTLFCENNQIESLDLSHNTNLEMLVARENQLVGLDVSLNPKLYYLDCGKNNLSQLNLRNGNIENFGIADASFNPDLLCIEVDDVEIAYSKNMWLKNNYAVFTENCSEYKNEMTYVPDNAFEGKLMYLGYDTGTPDDSVETAVLEHIKSLNFNNSGIKDLTGIEACTNLVEFLCDENRLTSLDFSSNRKLKTLSCVNNLITSLNIKSNPNLEYLRCDRNQISELEVSSNVLLFVFSCSNNNLTELDLMTNQNLYELNCQYNKIKRLDFSATDSLGFVACSDNQLQFLNLQNGHNDRLYSLYCENNQLTCIQVDDPENIPYYFDWRKDEKASYSTDCKIPPVKIDELNNQFIAVYPNPAHSKVFVNTGNKQVKLEVFNPTGSTVFCADNFVSNWIEIDKFNPGIYFFKVTADNNGSVLNTKLIIEK